MYSLLQRELIDVAKQRHEVLSCKSKMMEYQHSLHRYMSTRDFNNPEKKIYFIKSILEPSDKEVRQALELKT